MLKDYEVRILHNMRLVFTDAWLQSVTDTLLKQSACTW